MSVCSGALAGGANEHACTPKWTLPRGRKTSEPRFTFHEVARPPTQGTDIGKGCGSGRGWAGRRGGGPSAETPPTWSIEGHISLPGLLSTPDRSDVGTLDNPDMIADIGNRPADDLTYRLPSPSVLLQTKKPSGKLCVAVCMCSSLARSLARARLSPLLSFTDE